MQIKKLLRLKKNKASHEHLLQLINYYALNKKNLKHTNDYQVNTLLQHQKKKKNTQAAYKFKSQTPHPVKQVIKTTTTRERITGKKREEK